MKKLTGGIKLECGHEQVVSGYRTALSQNGDEQHDVWCIDCNDWARLEPVVQEQLNLFEEEEWL